MKAVLSMSRQEKRGSGFEKLLAMGILLSIALFGCMDKDRPTPKPDPVPEKPVTPTPKPTPDPDNTTTPTIIFSADFSKNFGKMTPVNIKGDEGWQVDENHQLAFISGADGKENKTNEDWLITPVFDFSTATMASISFDHLITNAKKPTEEQTVWVSSNYEGEIATATWIKLTISAYPKNSDKELINSGEIMLPEEMMGQAKVVIAFKYQSTKKQAATWKVKNITVKSVGGKLTNDPTPTPSPKAKDYSLRLSNGGVMRENKIVPTWRTDDKVSIWGIVEGDNKNLSAYAVMDREMNWKLNDLLAPEWEKVKRIDMAFLPSGEYNSQKEELKPKMEVNKKVGRFLVSHYYEDVLLGSGEIKGGVIEGSLNSPFKRINVTLLNDKKEQKIKDIRLTIKGALANATFSTGSWSGVATSIKLSYENKNAEWKKGEADMIMVAIPTQERSLSITLNCIDQNGQKVEVEQTVYLIDKGANEVTFRFPEAKIINPPLAFTLPKEVDARYWSEANRKAWNLLHSNYGGEIDEATARTKGWTNFRPLTDRITHSKTLYKDDVNLLTWRADMKEEQVMSGRDWGLIFGLESLDGTLVEVYPPLYFNEIGGYIPSMNGGRDGYYDNYCYITVPAGEYRMVCFVKYHKDYVGTINGANEKWYKLPYLDSRDYDETCRGGGVGRQYLNEPIPWSKSPYNGIEKVTVIDRVAKHSVAPRWRMGMTYQNRQDLNNNNPSYTNGKGGHPKKDIGKGSILQATLINNSNNTLQGTIVAKCEYLPMFNPIGYWRFDLHNDRNRKIAGEGAVVKFWNRWSHEVGRTSVTISPNSEKVANVEIGTINWKWERDGECGGEMLGPDTFIHFYWVDENGNEEMMKRVDYIYMHNAQKDNFGDPAINRNYNFSNGWYLNINWREFKVGYGPSEGRNVPRANGFNFF